MNIRHFLLSLLILFAASFLWAGGGTLITSDLPAAAKSQEFAGAASTLLDRSYRIIALKKAVQAKLTTKNYIPLQDIPHTVQQAVIAVEDNRFYQHAGFDIEGILRATLVNLQTGRIQEGGSTITQQLIKNLFLSSERSLSRKIEEFILAVTMELRYSKEEILEMYLNSIYFGSGMYGIGEAAAGYFAKTPAELSLAEAALLAGLPNAPSLNSPYVNFTAAKQRQAVVLTAMVKKSYIGPAQAEAANAEPIILAQHQP